MSKIHISIVIPSYGCAQSISELCRRLDAAVAQITPDYEIIIVDDGSPDNDWESISRAADDNSRVRGVKLSRNFGQHYATTAGLDFVRGDWVVVMDCDLQDQPEEIPKLYNKALEGYDVVVGRRAERQHGIIRKLLSNAFYRVFEYLTGVKFDPGVSSFGIYSAKVISNVQRMREQNRSFGLFVIWAGFRRTEVDIQHAARTMGRSSYTFKKMITLAFDSVVAYSDKLLRLTVLVGISISFLSFCYIFWLLMQYFFWSVPIAGWTSIIVSIYFTSGIIIGSIGIAGLYISKIFEEVKQRPLYLIDQTTFTLDDHDAFTN